MYKKQTSAGLKQFARGLMLGKYRNAISLFLAYNFILSFLSLLTATTSDSILGIIISMITNLIIVLFGSILQVGEYSFFLNIACKQPYRLTNLFTGFKVGADKIIITSIIIWLFVILPLIPSSIAFVVAAYTNNIPLFLIGCILLIIGVILSCWFSLRFSQVHYLLLDFPNYGSIELLKMSWKLMKRNSGRLLYLCLSFLPLNLAGLFSLGIGYLFISPYQQMTYSLFYLDLIQSKKTM